MNIVPLTIKDLLVVINEQMKDPRTDKVAARRTRAALETALYCAQGMYPSLDATSQQTASTQATSACICPVGARDRSCTAPIHRA